MIELLGPTVFVSLSVLLLASALLAATSRNLIHSVLWLALTLITSAALFAYLNAPFLAAIQLLLYAGGVITLMLFAVMLTDHEHEVRVRNPSVRRGPAAALAATLFALFAYATVNTELPALKGDAPPIGELALSLMTEHTVAFETLSMLLLAAMVGAIVLARRGEQ